MSFSIYTLDPEIKSLLNLDDFLGGLTVNEFVEELSKDHFLKGAEVNKLEYLDPKPYIRTFESTLRELKQLTIEANSQKDYMEKQVNEYEIKHSGNVIDMSDKIEKIVHQFNNLDTSISQVSQTIDPLNQSMNRITGFRDRSVDSIFLIRAYHGFFTKQRYDPLENLRVSKNFNDNLLCAKITKNLLAMAKKIETGDIPKTSQCVGTIEKFSEIMETQLLDKFEIALDNDEFEVMKDISNILEIYNEGVNVIQTFVSKSDFLNEIDVDNEPSILDDEKFWVHLNDTNNENLVKDDNMESLLNQLKFSIKGQARIVSQVFNNPTRVLKLFIQRIYAQSIQSKVNTALQYSLSVGSLAHVRLLQYLYQLISDFTKDLKDFFLNNELDNDHEISSILDQCFYDLFIEFTADNMYFIRERKHLEELVQDIARKFTDYNETAITNQQLHTIINNMNNLDFNYDTHGSSTAKAFGLVESKRLMKFRQFMKTQLADVNLRNRNSVDLEDTQDKKTYGVLNMSIAEMVIKSVIESVARFLELEPNKSPENASDVLEILLVDFVTLYIESGLEVIYNDYKQETNYTKINSTNFIDLSYLSNIHIIADILFLVSSCIKKIIIPCSANNPNIRNRMIEQTNFKIKRCESSINVILDSTVDLISDKLTYLLSRQKKKDFVADSVNNITEDDTEACELVSGFMTKVHEDLSRSLTDSNLSIVLNKVGLKFLGLLLDHFKKFTVDSTGGVILTKDVIRYQSVIENWEISELSEKFQILKEISNLFTVHPNLINSLVTEGQLAGLKPSIIRQYVGKRADFNPSYFERFFSFR